MDVKNASGYDQEIHFYHNHRNRSNVAKKMHIVSNLVYFTDVKYCLYFLHSFSEYYMYCLPNSTANVGLSVVDGVVCTILLILSVLGIAHFCVYGFGILFESKQEERNGGQLAVVLPGRSMGHGQIQGFFHAPIPGL